MEDERPTRLDIHEHQRVEMHVQVQAVSKRWITVTGIPEKPGARLPEILRTPGNDGCLSAASAHATVTLLWRKQGRRLRRNIGFPLEARR